MIKPNHHSQVGVALEIAHQFSVPVTTRGAGSSLTGGATPLHAGWVLDLSSLNKIEIDEGNMIARCGAGAAYFIHQTPLPRNFVLSVGMWLVTRVVCDA